MSTYQPVPVHAAKQIADAFSKSIVAIVCWDPAHKLVHTTSYGVTPVDKLSAATLGEILAAAAGCNLSKATMYEDFRTVEAAERALQIELLRAFVRDWIAEWNSASVDPVGKKLEWEDLDQWADLYRRAIELVARDSMPTREADDAN